MALLLFLFACGADRPPTIDPLPDRVDVGFDVAVTLRAKASDPDDDVLRFEWRQTAGPRLALSGTRSSVVRFHTRPLQSRPGTSVAFGPLPVATRSADLYVLRVQVRDGSSVVGKDIRVRAGSPSPGWPRVETGHALELSCGREGGDAAWSLAEQPAASHGRIEYGDRCRARLRPDRPGRYRIEEAGRTLVVQAGGWTGATECARSDCHGKMGDAWRATKHAKVATDEIARRGVPAVLYEPAGVQCEHCHGPGRFWTGYRAEVCATCHDAIEGDRLVAAWRSSPMSQPPDAAKSAQPCASCHVAFAAIARMDGRPPIPPREEPKEEGVTCAVCHDPHDATHPRQLRIVGAARVGDRTLDAGAGAICFSCHGGDLARWKEDALGGLAPHAPQGWMIAAAPAPHAQVVDACVGCHVRGGDGLHVGGHSFAARVGEAVNLVPCRPCHERPGETLTRVEAEIDGALGALRIAMKDALALAGVKSCEGVLAANVVPNRGRLAAADARGAVLAGCDGEVPLPAGIAVAAAALLVVEGDGSRGVHDAARAREVLRVGTAALGRR